MKLTLRPEAKERPVAVGGLAVTLRAVTPQMVSAQVARDPKDEDTDGLLSTSPKPYRVGPQDILLVTVWEHPEIAVAAGPYRTDSTSGNVVEEDGAIFFPYAGKIRVADLTTSEIRDLVTAKLAKVFRNPQVDVKVLAFRSQKVYVGGEVRNPAVYNITDVPFTLAQAMNSAGGLLPTADDTRVRLTRGTHSWLINFHALVVAGERHGEIQLRDGDSLQVPAATDEPVYVMGEVVRPGSQPLVHGTLSLARAISEAGGIQVASADATSIYVLRAGASVNTVDAFHLDGRNPASMVLADKFTLNAHDVVYVDAGTLVRFSRVMNLVLPTVSAVTTTASAGANYYYIKKHY